MRRPVSYEQEKAPEKPSCLLVSFRWLLIILNFLILLLGIAVIATIIVFVNRDEGNKGKEIYNNCTLCQRVMIAAAVIFGFVILSALVGFIALCSRKSCLLIGYAVFGFFMFLLMGAATTAVVLAHEGVVIDALNGDWNSIEAEGKCRLQTTFECSGWEHLCELETPTTTDEATSTSASDVTTDFATTTPFNATHLIAEGVSDGVPEGCADCGADNAVIAAYTTTCKDSFQNSFDKGFIPMLVVFSVFTLICFMVMFVSCKLRVQREKREDEVALLNERYV